MHSFFLRLAALGLTLTSSLQAQTGPLVSKNGGIGSSTSTFSSEEPTGGTYSVNGTNGKATFPIVNFKPGSTPSSPSNGDCWTTTASLFCRTNGMTKGHFIGGDQPISLAGASFDNNASNAFTGNAQYLYAPTLSSVMAHSIFVLPTLGTFNTPTRFASTFNMKFGDAGSSVPAGTGINFAGYECNFDTAQNLSDTQSGGNHCFGATINNTGSSTNEGVSIVANLSGTGAYYGSDLAVRNSNATADIHLYWAGCFGSATCGTAYEVYDDPGTTGDFTYGLNLRTHNIVGATNIGFSGSSHYQIEGSQSDLLRLAGGGSAGGMIISGSTPGGNSGLIRFRQYSSSATDVASINPTNGTIDTIGVVQAARVTLKATTFSALPTCNASAEGILAYITDASAVISAWHQAVTAGGGSNKTFVQCVGYGWRAF